MLARYALNFLVSFLQFSLGFFRFGLARVGQRRRGLRLDVGTARQVLKRPQIESRQQWIGQHTGDEDRGQSGDYDA